MLTTRGLSVLVLLLAILGGACIKRMERQVIAPAAYRTVNRRAPFLKAHMRDGRLYVLSDWSVDSVRATNIPATVRHRRHVERPCQSAVLAHSSPGTLTTAIGV